METIVIIGEESPNGKCAYCSKMEELRPYGKDGAAICYTCGMLPENISTTDAAFDAVLNGESMPPSKTQLN